MEHMLQERITGVRERIQAYAGELAGSSPESGNVGALMDRVMAEMRALRFDRVERDKIGNVIGVIKGCAAKRHLVLIAHVPARPEKGTRVEQDSGAGWIDFRPGLINALYAGALIKRTVMPLEGDVYICCVPREACCGYGITHLFGHVLRPVRERLYGVLLCEPTAHNIYLGHKGRLEYEIIVQGEIGKKFLGCNGINMLGAMFPLISELEKVSRALPHDTALGDSSLNIKDVTYSQLQTLEEQKQFRLVVDRTYIPEEDSRSILKRAQHIAEGIYGQNDHVSVNTALVRSRVKTATGVTLVSKKEAKPWQMQSHHPFVLRALEAIRHMGMRPEVGYWKHTITEGSYTYGELGIPTIGFGTGPECPGSTGEKISARQVEQGVCGTAMIVYRTIGMPTFGWSSDDI